MELRKSEETIMELVGMYEALRQSPLVETKLSTSNAEKDLMPEAPTRSKDSAAASSTTDTPSMTQNMSQSSQIPMETLEGVANTLAKMQSTLQALVPRMERFEQRLNEKDPVTGNPRYGAKTQNRVQDLVTMYHFLSSKVPPINQPPTQCTGDDKYALTECQSFLFEIQQSYVQERDFNQKLEAAALQKQQVEAEEAEARAQAEARRIAEAEAAQAKREAEEKAAAEAALHAQAEAVRAERLEENRREQEWVASIGRGPDRVKVQIEKLKQSTAQDPGAQQKALASLTTIFQQIHGHPEEPNFRRIKRNHPQFVEDIGRYPGGVEVLLASGFELGTIDDVPCYISKEPNLETDMDAWSAWFDLLKATLEILQAETQGFSK